MHRCHAYCCLLRSCCLDLSHNAIYFPWERERVAWRGQVTVTKGTTLTAVPLTERKSKLFASKIQFRVLLLRKANWNSVVSPIYPNQRSIAISNKWRYIEQVKKITDISNRTPWLADVHVVQWLGMFLLDLGRCFHGTYWNVSCLACALWVKERKRHVFHLEMTQNVKCEPFISR